MSQEQHSTRYASDSRSSLDNLQSRTQYITSSVAGTSQRVIEVNYYNIRFDFYYACLLYTSMGVGIPGTGMVGLPIAVALGALIGKSDYQLEVLRDCTSVSYTHLAYGGRLETC